MMNGGSGKISKLFALFALTIISIKANASDTLFVNSNNKTGNVFEIKTEGSSPNLFLIIRIQDNDIYEIGMVWDISLRNDTVYIPFYSFINVGNQNFYKENFELPDSLQEKKVLNDRITFGYMVGFIAETGKLCFEFIPEVPCKLQAEDTVGLTQQADSLLSILSKSDGICDNHSEVYYFFTKLSYLVLLNGIMNSRDYIDFSKALSYCLGPEYAEDSYQFWAFLRLLELNSNPDFIKNNSLYRAFHGANNN